MVDLQVKPSGKFSRLRRESVLEAVYVIVAECQSKSLSYHTKIKRLRLVIESHIESHVCVQNVLVYRQHLLGKNNCHLKKKKKVIQY